MEFYENENTFKEKLHVFFIKNQRTSKSRIFFVLSFDFSFFEILFFEEYFLFLEIQNVFKFRFKTMPLFTISEIQVKNLSKKKKIA